MKKILIFSDVHGAKEEVIKVINKEKADLVVGAGDVYNDQEFIKKYFNYFAPGDDEITQQPAFSKMDKSDKWASKLHHEFFNQSTAFSFCGKNFWLIHYYDFKTPLKSLSKKYKQLIKDKKIDYIISGHTHIPYIYPLNYGYTMMNPGSMFKPRNASGRSYIVGTFDGKNFKFKINIIKK